MKVVENTTEVFLVRFAADPEVQANSEEVIFVFSNFLPEHSTKTPQRLRPSGASDCSVMFEEWSPDPSLILFLVMQTLIKTPKQNPAIEFICSKLICKL